MKKVFASVLFLLVGCSVFFGCKEAPEEKPTGSLVVRVKPAGAAKSVNLTVVSVPVKYAPSDSTTFRINNLSEGAYWVTFEPNEGYEHVYLNRYQVKAGETTDLGTITMTKKIVIDPYFGKFSATLNGSQWHSGFHTSDRYDSTLIIWSTGNRPDLPSSTETMVLKVKQITGPGTYSATAVGGVSYNLNTLYGDPDPYLSWSSAVTGGACSVTITRFDTVSNRVSGNFSFHALPVPNGPSNVRTATNGTFTDLKME